MHFFLFFGFAYSASNDLMNAYVWKAVGMTSRLITWISLPCGIVFLLIRYWMHHSWSEPLVPEVATGCQIAAFLLIQLKSCCIGFEMPGHVIRMTATILD
jgi:membrane-bound acyltransferase YfiQ involved in biofilm formation